MTKERIDVWFNPDTQIVTIEGCVFHVDWFERLRNIPDDCMMTMTPTIRDGIKTGGFDCRNADFFPEKEIRRILDEIKTFYKSYLEYHKQVKELLVVVDQIIDVVGRATEKTDGHA
jgi:hypothetical protein